MQIPKKVKLSRLNQLMDFENPKVLEWILLFQGKQDSIWINRRGIK